MTALLAELWPYLVAAAGAVLAVLGLYGKGRADGAAAARAKSTRAALDAERQRQEIEDEIAQDTDLARRARDAGLVRRDR